MYNNVRRGDTVRKPRLCSNHAAPAAGLVTSSCVLPVATKGDWDGVLRVE